MIPQRRIFQGENRKTERNSTGGGEGGGGGFVFFSRSFLCRVSAIKVKIGGNCDRILLVFKLSSILEGVCVASM
jgi:hypothetical protein